MWALYIGISKHRLFKKFDDTYIYSITFIMYGIMMTFALLADSFSNNFGNSLKLFVGIADVDLTSTVGTFFLYCGLSDLGIINPKSFKTKLIFIFNSIILLFSWYYAFEYSGSKSGIWSFVLYEVVVGISCGIYLVLQVVYLLRNNRLEKILWLIAAGVTGGVGLGITLYSHKWCEYFGARLSSSYAWFFLSDVAMLLIAKYIVSSRGNDELEKKYNKCCFSSSNEESENDEESNYPGIKYQPAQPQGAFFTLQSQPQPQPQPILLQQPQGGYILLHSQIPSQQPTQYYFKQ
ncbi:hypothetical protein DICPUDRAFT_97742 [Dictyostelium purpureum]|uniref:Transmembrane protein n=1 Tax=Dictyostelium purpureum TaxID=5786 RepID=F0ZJE9_DICPU|nr:uncharacterized protein DICPUDRAFT_97742 [Dictyostelium purpureum]EGC35970.1 hypothetical protein DICPUDRAFT_97742 [Dictyostelium purpureum]|eukprot:XP_003287543.1 hypothetical protein DICPUDRAFT_97742 [Dictyostelium purpureum]